MSLRTFAVTLFVAFIGAFATSANAATSPSGSTDKIDKRVNVTSSPVKGSAIPRYHLTATLDAPAERVWKAIADCGSYVGIMPRVEAAKQLKKGKRTQCQIRVDLPFPLSHLDSLTTVATETKGTQRILSWKLVKGDYKAHEGQWTVTSINGGKQTFVRYSAWVVPDLSVSDAMIRSGQRKELPAVIAGLRRHLATKRVAAK